MLSLQWSNLHRYLNQLNYFSTYNFKFRYNNIYNGIINMLPQNIVIQRRYCIVWFCNLQIMWFIAELNNICTVINIPYKCHPFSHRYCMNNRINFKCYHSRNSLLCYAGEVIRVIKKVMSEVVSSCCLLN